MYLNAETSESALTRLVTCLLLLMVSTLSAQPSPETRDICQWEFFNATCPDGHVVIMTTAKFGRMKVGRCIPTDYQVGCAADVIDLVDARCSGRQNCSILIPDPAFYNVQTCRKDLVAYFEAGYQCIKVAGGKLNRARHCHGPLTLTQTPGYLASSVTLNKHLGSAKCPWSIRAPPGQRINITLLDFTARSVGQPYPSSMVTYQNTASCPIYAVFKEEGSLEYLRMCGGRQRRTMVYSSAGNEVEVHIVNIGRDADNANFLLKYQAIGCPDIEPQESGYIVRQDDTLRVSCNYTTERWHLVCKGSQWIGSVKNCSKRGPPSKGGTDLRTSEEGQAKEEDVPFGLLIAIAIGIIIGIVLGFVFLMVVFSCRKSRVKQRRQRETNALLMDHQSQESGDQNIYKLINMKHQGVAIKEPPCDCVLAAEVQLANNALDGKLEKDQYGRSLRGRESDYVKCKIAAMPHGPLLMGENRGSIHPCVTDPPADGVHCHADSWCPTEEIYKANLKWGTYPRSNTQKQQMVTFKGDPDVTLHECPGEESQNDDNMQRSHESSPSRDCSSSNSNVEVNAHSDVRFFKGHS